MTDQEWERICKRASWTHGLAMTALIMVPCAVWALAPEFVARFKDALSSSPYGEGIEAAIGYAWLICLIGCFFPPRRIFGRGENQMEGRSIMNDKKQEIIRRLESEAIA